MAVRLTSILTNPGQRQALEERFWPKVDRRRPDECWPWMAALSTGGYGNFKAWSYQNIRAHRIAYALTTGEDPGDLLICHRCDNRPCCNPAHLFPGTDKDNSDDKIAKGRARSGNHTGANNPRALLSEDDVREVWRLIGKGWTNTAIGQKFKVHHATISVIRRGKAWRHMMPQPESKAA